MNLAQCNLGILILAASLVLGCKPTQATGTPSDVSSSEVPSRRPTLEEMQRVLATGYLPPPTAQQECFGRLLFNIAVPVQWPTDYENSANLFTRSFSKNVFDRGDEIRFGKARIAVLGPIDKKISERIFSTTPAESVADLAGDIKSAQAYIARLRKSGASSETTAKQIAEQEDWIKLWEGSILKEQQEYTPFELGLPDSYAYSSTKTVGAGGGSCKTLRE